MYQNMLEKHGVYSIILELSIFMNPNTQHRYSKRVNQNPCYCVFITCQERHKMFDLSHCETRLHTLLLSKYLLPTRIYKHYVAHSWTVSRMGNYRLFKWKNLHPWWWAKYNNKIRSIYARKIYSRNARKSVYSQCSVTAWTTNKMWRS